MNNAVAESSVTIFHLVINSSLMAKMVLILLLIFSVVSWAIILNKFFAFRRAKREDANFLSVFAKADSLVNIYNCSREMGSSPVARIFLTGYRMLYQIQEMSKPDSEQKGQVTPAKPISITSKDIKGISIALDKAINREIERMASRLEFLATTGSTTPFIGLFGTVWGIMNSFRALSNVNQATLAMVAPGIAEALIATAMGLFAAIPAVIAYNRYITDVERLVVRYDNFLEEFSAILQRQSRV